MTVRANNDGRNDDNASRTIALTMSVLVAGQATCTHDIGSVGVRSHSVLRLQTVKFVRSLCFMDGSVVLHKIIYLEQFQQVPLPVY